MSGAYIQAVGLAAPGFNNWSESIAILRGDQPYAAAPLSAFAPTLLPANEQRRATATVRIAFRVAEEAVRNSGLSAGSLATVFASSDADMMVSHRICTALAQTQRMVSPTDFHNSVHNAPSGYWHIGARSHLPSSAIAAFDYSFAAGLLEALTQVQIEQQPTLLVCYDVPAPEPLLAKRPLGHIVAVALLLTPERSRNALAHIELADLNCSAPESVTDTAAFETLRLSNPAGRAFPVLQLIARQQSGDIVLQRSAERFMKLRIAVT
jgi:hypothetical protein